MGDQPKGYLNLKKYEGGSVVLLNVMTISIFIVILYFTYGIFIAKQIITSEINDLVKDVVNTMKILSPDRLWGEFVDSSKMLSFDPNKETDNIVRKANNEIVKKAAIALGVGSVVIIILILVLWNRCNRRFNFKKMGREMVGFVVIVALVEISFYTFIVRNYLIVDPNFIKKLLILKMKEYANG